MRPLRLTMTAFGPYAGTETVDFDALTDLGLFVVAGNNGSGKTTIFDALHYALYGTLPGRRATYIRLRSDHADSRAECSVTLDFAAHGAHWRVERSPKQTRAKRRGNGTTEAPAAATLYRLDQGTPKAITNRVEEVRAKCAELVGLSGKQFERVALLPQGQFSRVLTESSTERRELLRTLFSSEIFDDATTWLTTAAAQATAGDRQALEHLDHRQGALADELGQLIGRPVGPAAPALHNAINDYRRLELAAQTATVNELETAAQHATRDHQAAATIAEQLERRSQVLADLDRHHLAKEQHQADLTRLKNARSAVPVASHAQTLARHHAHLEDAQQRRAEIAEQLNRALSAAGLNPVAMFERQCLEACGEQIAALQELLTQRREIGLRTQDINAHVARCHGDIRRIDNEIKTLGEHHDVASSQLRQATATLDSLSQAADIDECEQALRTAQAQLAQRTELAELESEHSRLVQQTTTLDIQRDQLDQARETAVQAQSLLADVQQQADSAYAGYQEADRRLAACNDYQAAATKLQASRHEQAQAQAHTDQLWDAFIAGTAARVAQALTDDEPCPVCGSCEHPTPAAPHDGDEIVTQAQVTAARERSEKLLAQVRALESQIETLHTADSDIAVLLPVELSAQVATAKAMALGARSRADEIRQAAALYDQIDQELTAARSQRADLDGTVREIDHRRSRLQGALGPAANQPVAVLRALAADAVEARTQADQLASRREQLAATIDRATADLEAIGLNQIAAASRRASTQDQLVDRQRDLDGAQQRSAEIDNELAGLTVVNLDAEYELERRTQAARQARDLVGEAITSLALEHDASEAIRRAQSVLNDRLQQSPFSQVEQAMAAYVEPDLIDQLEAQTSAYRSMGEHLRGQLEAFGDLPDSAPDLVALESLARERSASFAAANTDMIRVTADLDRFVSELTAIENERAQRQTTDLGTRRLERVAAMAKGDNDRNTSLENWVLAAHLRDVVELANVRLARSTHQRFQLCVMDDGENKRGKWGLDLGVEDTVTGTQRPTAGLSGGELFQASLALALGLADAVMNQSAGVSVDALFIDEGFGSLDETSVERAIDLLDELRDRGAMVGVITHVPALLDALPLGVSVIEAADGQGSTIRQSQRAA